MRKIRDKIEGPYLIDEDTVLAGMVTQTLTIDSGINFDLRGMVAGNLIVGTGSTVEIYGMVTGNLIVRAGSIVGIYGMVIGTVINEGAEITIYGTVGKITDHDENFRTQITSGAVVKE